MRFDPTRTGMLRRKMDAAVRRAFLALKLNLVDLVLKEDAFGRKLPPTFTYNVIRKLKSGKYRLLSHRGKNLGTFATRAEAEERERQVKRFKHFVQNVRWKFEPPEEQVKLFKQWVKQQTSEIVGSKTAERLWKDFLQQAYTKGVGRSYDDEKGFLANPVAKDEFLRSSFGQKVAPAKVQLLAQRSLSDLEGVTDAMSTKMVKTLVKGFEAGDSPRAIARALAKEVDISLPRALTIARTEVIAAHAQGQLAALRDLGVAEVGVQVEWSTAGDDRVCEFCDSMNGTVYPIDEADGLIPAHPNCRCAFIPAGSILNRFCPTGEGGGVDPTCGKGDGGASDAKAASIWERARKLPAKAVAKVKAKVKEKYGKLEQRYGPKYAKAIIGAALVGLPVPLPGASLALSAPVLALAELHRLARGGKSKVTENVDVEEEARKLIRELEEEFDEEL